MNATHDICSTVQARSRHGHGDLLRLERNGVIVEVTTERVKEEKELQLDVMMTFRHIGTSNTDKQQQQKQWHRSTVPYVLNSEPAVWRIRINWLSRTRANFAIWHTAEPLFHSLEATKR
jgi:hypothetical protein